MYFLEGVGGGGWRIVQLSMAGTFFRVRYFLVGNSLCDINTGPG